jgi:hypothetical protein
MLTFPDSFGANTVAASLVRLAQAAARPNFELQFNIAQNVELARLDAKIAEFQDSDFGRGKTALLRVKATRLGRELAEVKDYNATVATNRQTVKDLLDQLEELRGLADPTSVADFETKQAAVLDSLDRLRTATTHRLGAPDGLADTKAEGLAAIEGIVTNNFTSAADIQAAQDAIDILSADLDGALTIIEINNTLSANLIKTVDRSLDEANLKIDDIEIAERKKQIDEIQALRDRTAQSLTSISFAFEAAQALTDALAQSTLPQEIEPGSVLNLFA